MKIDLHVHSLPISRCAHHQPEEIPAFFKKQNFDAICLTNHCYPQHSDYLALNLKDQAKKYIEIYRRCRDSGKVIGIKVFFGLELKLINEEHQPEFLLYGLSEDTFVKSYPLYGISQKELFDFCNHENIIMIQAHPFRHEQGYQPADIRYMHGIEVYNPHPSFPVRYHEALTLADQYGFIKTAGSDFHIESQVGSAGMIVGDAIEDQYMLRDFLRSKKQKLIHEVR